MNRALPTRLASLLALCLLLGACGAVLRHHGRVHDGVDRRAVANRQLEIGSVPAWQFEGTGHSCEAEGIRVQENPRDHG